MHFIVLDMAIVFFLMYKTNQEVLLKVYMIISVPNFLLRIYNDCTYLFIFVILEQFDVLWSLDLGQLLCLTTNIDQLPIDIFKPLEYVICQLIILFKFHRFYKILICILNYYLSIVIYKFIIHRYK